MASHEEPASSDGAPSPDSQLPEPGVAPPDPLTDPLTEQAASSAGAPADDQRVAPPVGDPAAERLLDPTSARRGPWSATTVTSRPCAWCAHPVAVVRRPGRPRLYCGHACRQRAYEHRHGFRHARTVTELPGQARGERWGGTGYERGIVGYARGKVHALRTSVRPEGHRRETLCGLLASPAPVGRHFSPREPRACASCTKVVASAPLTLGVNVSNELARLRALIKETAEERLDPGRALAWLQGYAPEFPSPPPDSTA